MRKVLGGGDERNGEDTKATTQMFGHDESADAWMGWVIRPSLVVGFPFPLSFLLDDAPFFHFLPHPVL